MKSLDIKYLMKLSFPDSTVTEMIIDKSLRTLKIKVDTAWLDNDGGITLNNGELMFFRYDTIECRSYNKIDEDFTWVKCQDIVVLKDICEFQIADNKIFLRGFGRSSGFWTEIIIVNSSVTFIFEN